MYGSTVFAELDDDPLLLSTPCDFADLLLLILSLKSIRKLYRFEIASSQWFVAREKKAALPRGVRTLQNHRLNFAHFVRSACRFCKFYPAYLLLTASFAQY
jgi:hypothetical protein